MIDANDDRPEHPFPGGDTPYVTPELMRRTAPEHEPFRWMKDGVDQTRDTQLAILCVAWREIHDRPLEGHPPRETMVEMIAAANHDLRALGLEPLIAISEVEQIAPLISWDQ